jgi:hypothetical protein
VLNLTSLPASESITRLFDSGLYLILTSLRQSAAMEVREALSVHAGVVGPALRVEDQTLEGDEGPQEAEVRLVAVEEAAIEVEDAVRRAALAEVDVEVEEASDSIPTSVRCCYAVIAFIFSCRVLHNSCMAQPHYKLDPHPNPRNVISRRPLQGIPGRLNV